MSKKNFISYGDGETLISQIAYLFSHLITGHRIKDKSGNAMTARDVLKVDGYLETTDDSTNAQTVISDAPTDVTWAQYITKSASEKQGKKWLIHDVPGICAKINAEMMSLLWENPSPTASFSEQSITGLTTLKDYKLFLIICLQSTTTSRSVVTLSSDIGANVIFSYPSPSASQGSCTLRRIFTINTSEDKIDIGDCLFGYTGQAGQSASSSLIPYQIYGLKTTLDGTMFMKAEDLGTSADKCMLSDGETSVETKIGAMESNFQDGVDAVYDAVVAKGSTPASHSLSDVVTGIGNIPTGITPSGTLSIATNGTHDVTNYASANVQVPASAVVSGTKSITANGNSQDVTSYKYVNVNVPNTVSAAVVATFDVRSASSAYSFTRSSGYAYIVVAHTDDGTVGAYGIINSAGTIQSWQGSTDYFGLTRNSATSFTLSKKSGSSSWSGFIFRAL